MSKIRSAVRKARKMGFNKRRRMANAPAFIARPPGMTLQTFDKVATADMSTSATLDLLHSPDRTSTNYNNRIGDSTTIKSIRFKYTIKPGSAQNGATPSFGQWVRVLLFWDEQPNGAFPAGTLPLLALTPNSQSEPQYAYRFKLLRDARHYIQPYNLGQAQDAVGDFFLKNLSLVSNFNANNGSIGDINTGSLLAYFIGDTTITTSNVPVITYTSRTRFIA